jgi:hypothetical protein
MAMARDIRKVETAAQRTLREKRERQQRLAEQEERNAEAEAAAQEAAELARQNAPATHVERSEGYQAPSAAKAAAGPTENKAAESAPAKTAKRK